MNGKAFVDTNILIYAHDKQGGQKPARAQWLLTRLWNEGRGVLSTQVLQEFCVNVRRKFQQPMSSKQVREAVLVYGRWQTVVNATEAVLQALDIEERHRLSFWDAMIVQAAQSAKCEILYSEDFAHGREYDSVLVVNPFVDEEMSRQPAEDPREI